MNDPNSDPMSDPFPTAILASGGMDSFLVWAFYHVRCEPTVNVFVNVGQKYRRKERWAWGHLRESIGKGFSGIEVIGQYLGNFETPSGIIPNRNAHLILAAATVSPRIALGILHGEINSDKSEEFLRAMERVLDISNRGQYWNANQGLKHELLTPLSFMTKTEAIADYMKTGLPPEWLLHTISCYDAESGHCGACPSCFKRWVALTNNGLTMAGTGLDFKADPRVFAEASGILEKTRDGIYDVRRASEIRQAMDIAHLGSL